MEKRFVDYRVKERKSVGEVEPLLFSFRDEERRRSKRAAMTSSSPFIRLLRPNARFVAWIQSRKGEEADEGEKK
jgi:hypothetical protein